VIPTVLLFDIDGTLITTGGAGRRSLEKAFIALHQRDDAMASFRLDGMTDKAIIRMGLEAIGVPVSPAMIEAVLVKYLECLSAEVQQADAAVYRIHRGMQEAVAAGRKLGAAIGLGTGNVKDGAKIKLQRVGLFQAFDFGGFGDDHELRPEIIRRGAQRGVKQLRVPWSEARVVVIGDTPKDVAAAQAIGAQCMGVGTGHFTAEQLREAGADWAFDDLSTPGALDALLDG
jgi:phosphoglycolate phosphatase